MKNLIAKIQQIIEENLMYSLKYLKYLLCSTETWRQCEAMDNVYTDLKIFMEQHNKRMRALLPNFKE